jgi:hypothetical protein
MYNSYVVIGINSLGNQTVYWEATELCAMNSIKKLENRGYTVESYYCPIKAVYNGGDSFKTIQ